MEPRIQAEYSVVNQAEMLGEKLGSAYKSKLKLNIFEIRDDHWIIKLQDCRDFNNYVLWIDGKVKHSNLCTAPTSADTDAAETNLNAGTIAKMCQQEQIFYPLQGIPGNDECNIFLQLMRDQNAMMTATTDAIVTQPVKKDNAIMRVIGLAPEAQLFG
jgi:hypothetical protein